MTHGPNPTCSLFLYGLLAKNNFLHFPMVETNFFLKKFHDAGKLHKIQFLVSIKFYGSTVTPYMIFPGYFSNLNNCTSGLHSPHLQLHQLPG